MAHARPTRGGREESRPYATTDASLPLTLRQLQYAVAIADELSFRRAALRCHVSQPSLSAQLAELETGLGVRLFERDRRRVLITPAGEEIVERARRTLLEAADLADAARRRQDPLQGPLRIGVIPTIAPYLLPDIAPALSRAFPRLSLQWTEGRTGELVPAVDGGSLDAALLALEADLAGLETEKLLDDPFVVAFPAGHALAKGKQPLRSQALRDEQVLLLDDGHCLRDQALSYCARSRAQELGFRATSLPTLVQMVAAGAGITLLPRMAVKVESRSANLALRELASPSPSRTIVLAWRSKSPLAPAMRQLAAAIRGKGVGIR